MSRRPRTECAHSAAVTASAAPLSPLSARSPSESPLAEPPKRYATAAETDSSELRLHANEGATPPELIDALARARTPIALDRLRTYPSPRALEELLATAHGVDPERLVLTAGAGDAIDRLFRRALGAGRDLLVPVPTFELFHSLAEGLGSSVRTVDWVGSFPEEELLEAVRQPAIGLLALVTPNNPSGRTVPLDAIERLLRAAAPKPVLLDLLYIDYAASDPTDRLLEHENAVVVRSFSKAWGLAGCRVGYALGSPVWIDRLRATGPPYPISGPSLEIVAQRLRLAEAPETLLRDRRLDAHVRQVCSERRRVAELLESLGASVEPSEANFVLADLGVRAELTASILAARGIHVRRFGWRRGLESKIRISMPSDERDLERLLHGLREALDPEAILFDLDGVLADPRRTYREAIFRTTARFGVEVSADEIDAITARGDANNDWVVCRRLLADRGREVELEEIVRVFQQILLGSGDPGEAPDAGPRAEGLLRNDEATVDIGLIRRLAARRPVAIVTGRPRAEAFSFLSRHALGESIGALVAQEDAPQKPDPEPVRRALAELGASSGIFVGDTVDDVRAARRAGLVALGVIAPGADGEAVREQLLDAGAAAVFPDTASLLEVLS